MTNWLCFPDLGLGLGIGLGPGPVLVIGLSLSVGPGFDLGLGDLSFSSHLDPHCCSANEPVWLWCDYASTGVTSAAPSLATNLLSSTSTPTPALASIAFQHQHLLQLLSSTSTRHQLALQHQHSSQLLSNTRTLPHLVPNSHSIKHMPQWLTFV